MAACLVIGGKFLGTVTAVLRRIKRMGHIILEPTGRFPKFKALTGTAHKP